MANVYDPPGMRAGADAIEKELQAFKDALAEVQAIMDVIKPEAFDDQTGQRLVNMYNREAVPCLQETAATIQQYVHLLRTCAQKFGSAIDNSSSYLIS
jgi:hypothetical protein